MVVEKEAVVNDFIFCQSGVVSRQLKRVDLNRSSNIYLERCIGLPKKRFPERFNPLPSSEFVFFQVTPISLPASQVTLFPSIKRKFGLSSFSRG